MSANRLLDGVRRIGRALLAPVAWRELAPLLLVFAMLPWLKLAIDHYVHGKLFRDANMFDYAAWCVLHGDRLYEDVATPDGPFVVFYQAVQFAIAQSSRFVRLVDLTMVALIAGPTLALLVPRRPHYRVLRFVVWTVVGAALGAAAVVHFDLDSSVQREEHYAVIGALGVALVYASAGRSRRAEMALLAAGGFFAMLPAWGKHVGVVYLALALVVAWLPVAESSRRRRLASIAGGAAAACALVLALLLAFGSVREFAFWYFRYDLRAYRYFFRIAIQDELASGSRHAFFALASYTSLLGCAAIAVRALPARLVGVMAAPAVQLAVSLAQQKNWGYHFIPVEISAYLAVAVALAHAWTAYADASEHTWAHGAAVLATCWAFVHFILVEAQSSPWLDRKTPKYAIGSDEKSAADALAEHTRSDDRVLYFGDDPIVPLVAKRKPAIPNFLPWMIDFDLYDKFPDDPGIPTASQRAALVSLGDSVRGEACARLVAKPPAAFVLKDNSIGFQGDNLQRLGTLCPDVGGMIKDRYHLAGTWGSHRVYLRDDRP